MIIFADFNQNILDIALATMRELCSVLLGVPRARIGLVPHTHPN